MVEDSPQITRPEHHQARDEGIPKKRGKAKEKE